MILEKETLEKIGKDFASASKRAMIVCKCDYCGVIFERMKNNILMRSKNNKKDAGKKDYYQQHFGSSL